MLLPRTLVQHHIMKRKKGKSQATGSYSLITLLIRCRVKTQESRL